VRAGTRPGNSIPAGLIEVYPGGELWELLPER
jgi:hypothetical protein